MHCTAAVRHFDDVAIVDLAGRIVLGDGSDLVRTTIKDLVDVGELKILVNLRQVTYLDSSGLGELVGAFAAVRHQGGQMKIVNTQHKLQNLLQLTKLYTVFDSFDSESEALGSFSKA